MWNTDESTFRGRRLLVLESLFIHHPQATVIMLSSTLNDTALFLPYRRRGYQIYCINISISRMIKWRWYLSSRSKDFLTYWNTSGTYFYSHISDYMRAISLYLYGGTYMDMDALILRPLPKQEFIGFDRSGAGDSCAWCVKNSSGLYLAPGFMRFRPNRTVLRRVLENTFDRRFYDQSCFNCVGPKAFTEHIMRHVNANDSELANLKLLEPHRLYPFMWKETLSIFYDVQKDTALQLADLMKRSYSIHFFGHMSDRYSIARGSLIDLLFEQLDLGDIRPKISNRDQPNTIVRLIHLSLYIYTPRKQGRFLGRDVIYLRLNKTFNDEHIKWNMSIQVSNGTIMHSNARSLSNLNQAQVNIILNEMSYEPFESTSIDILKIHLTTDQASINTSITILVFSKWVTFLTKTMGIYSRWPVVQRLAASVERYFPQTVIHIASDLGQPIDRNAFLNFTSFDNINGYNLNTTLFIHNMPEDSGLSKCRNYLVNLTFTPFFFILDDDFTIEEDSHIGILLEIMYTHEHMDIIAGKIPEDIKAFNDFSGVFLRYNQTLELRRDIPDYREDHALFIRPYDELEQDEKNPCRQVDFVPNVFMGRKVAVHSVGWDEDFKLGEHEDFFIRFGQANRTVYTCQYIQVHHYQEPWWKKVNSPYFSKRARVHEYFKKMLIKHDLKRLITFGYTNTDLNKNVKSIR
jgi:hypothetical protein